MHQFDVVIVGAGIVGLSTAYFLKNSGISKICVLVDKETPSNTFLSPGYFLAGQIENYSRLVHLKDRDLAKKFWQFGTTGYHLLTEFLIRNSIPHHLGDKIRLLTSDAELKEAQIAANLLKGAGFSATILSESQFPFIKKSARVKGVQLEPQSAGFINVKDLYDNLIHLGKLDIRPAKVTKIDSQHDKMSLSCENGLSLSCEIIVLANHLNIPSLIPNFDEILVPFTDQIDVYSHKRDTFPIGAFFCGNFGQEWGLIGPDKVFLGGARFLRPMSGIGHFQPKVEGKVSKYLASTLANTFQELDLSDYQGSVALQDIQPCDELPIIGPLYSEPRILIATGFNGSGISNGFHSGLCLAELIEKGHSSTLPYELWPHRLRSL